jgi:alpha-glucosidase (family GH31 glycosyl hydrolase)
MTEKGQKDQAGQAPGWTGYTWDSNLFPDSQSYLNHLKSLGLRATLNLHPASGVQVKIINSVQKN